MRRRKREYVEIPDPAPEVILGLQSYFMPNGCFRIVDPERRETEGIKYKKGYEVRLVADTKDDLAIIQGMLKQAGFKFGSPFVKGYHWIQPMYGRVQVERFISLMDRQIEAKSASEGE